jgi:ADP-dependent NAD(P)H-hydrate dehydratase / NAD(P)H-hydrate epimerase
VAEHAARLDAVMLRVAGDDPDLLADARINAVCVGPGLGVDARAVALVRAVLAVREDHATYRGIVLDADALTILSQYPELFAMLHKNCVLTPHAGEFARVFPDIAAKLAAPATTGPAYSKVDACREAAKRAGCVVLFKGPDTVIAGPDGRCSINSAHYDRAAPWLATAGSGDVLAGFITGLLARGFAPMQAAETAAWLHVECARSFGPGLIAEDLAEELPNVFRALVV